MSSGSHTPSESLAEIVQFVEGQPEWLLHWKSTERAWSFLGGSPVNGESPHDCITNLCSDSLQMSADRVIVASTPSGRLRNVGQTCATGEPTKQSIVLHRVAVPLQSIQDRIAIQTVHVWATLSDIESGALRDGNPVCPNVRHWLQQTGWLSVAPSRRLPWVLQAIGTFETWMAPPCGGASMRHSTTFPDEPPDVRCGCCPHSLRGPISIWHDELSNATGN